MFLLICAGGLYGLYFGENLISRRSKILGGGVILAGIVLFQNKILGVVNLNDFTNLWSDFLAFSF
jgi:hypothetical protein